MMSEQKAWGVTSPSRTVDQIRRDVMALERELAHHWSYAKVQEQHDQSEDIAEAANDLHHAAIKLGVIVMPFAVR